MYERCTASPSAIALGDRNIKIDWKVSLSEKMCSKTCHLKSKSPLFHSPSVAAVLNIYHQHIWGGYVKSANVGGQRSATKLKGRTERASNRRVFNNCYSFQRERDLALFVCRLIVAPLIFLISFSHGCYHRVLITSTRLFIVVSTKKLVSNPSPFPSDCIELT